MTKTIQIVSAPDLEYFRNEIVGIHRYLNDVEGIDLAYSWSEEELTGNIRNLIERDSIDGMLVIAHNEEEESRFVNLGIPVINLSNAVINPQLHIVTQDDVRAGEMAAEHLLECGCQHFAFWGINDKKFSEDRVRGFKRVLGHFEVLEGYEEKDNWVPRENHQNIESFMENLPPHTGVFTVLDYFAVIFMRTARKVGLNIPDDMAVLGAGDDVFMTALGPLPISSISLPAFEIGYEAAAMLDRLMADHEPIKELEFLTLEPSEVVGRKSTEIFFHKDPVVRMAKQYIHEHPACNVSEIVAHVSISQSGLQSKFKALTGRSMLQEIHRVRLNRAVKLLQSSQQSIELIAEEVGFASVQ